MSLPKVTLVTLDGRLGTRPNAGGKMLAVLGTSTAGTANVPTGLARPKDIVSQFQSGPLVEQSAYWQSRYGRAVAAIKVAAAAVGTGSIDDTGVTGTSVATLTPDAAADFYDGEIKVITGGTIGVSGITYQSSLDQGRTLSPTTGLGTANSITLGGAVVHLAAGTLVTGDVIRFNVSPPAPTASELHDALTALKNSNLPWEFAAICTPITAAIFDQLETDFAAMQAAGKYRSWFGSARMPNVGESESAYKAALDAIFTSKSTTIGTVCAGDAKTSSAVNGLVFRRPAGLALGAMQASVSEEIDIADVDLGAVPGVSIVDNNGNPENHDEAIFPGLDDSRFATFRTWDGRNGVYVTRPRILCTAGSDFTIGPYRRVMNLYAETLLWYMTRRLAKPIRVSKKTGLIVEVDALEIELGAQKILESVLLKKPKASALSFTVARDDDLLGTKTLTGDGGLVPLAYPEFINLTIGFVNPSLQIIKV
jgi:hypothetical protein